MVKLERLDGKSKIVFKEKKLQNKVIKVHGQIKNSA